MAERITKRMKDFRFVFLILSSLFALTAVGIAVYLQAMSYYHNSNTEGFTPVEVYTPGTTNLIIWLVGLAATLFGASKALPGSPELTDPELRELDNTLNPVKDKEQNSKKPKKPAGL